MTDISPWKVADRGRLLIGDNMDPVTNRPDDPAATPGGHRIDVPLRVNGTLIIAIDELGWRFSRSSGPGGQGVNTADSRVELMWNPSRSPAVAALVEQQ